MIYDEKYCIHDCRVLDFFKTKKNKNDYTLVLDNSAGFMSDNQLVFSDCTVVKENEILNKWCLYDEIKNLSDNRIDYNLFQMTKNLFLILFAKKLRLKRIL